MHRIRYAAAFPTPWSVALPQSRVPWRLWWTVAACAVASPAWHRCFPCGSPPAGTPSRSRSSPMRSPGSVVLPPPFACSCAAPVPTGQVAFGPAAQARPQFHHRLTLRPAMSETSLPPLAPNDSKLCYGLRHVQLGISMFSPKPAVCSRMGSARYMYFPFFIFHFLLIFTISKTKGLGNRPRSYQLGGRLRTHWFGDRPRNHQGR